MPRGSLAELPDDAEVVGAAAVVVFWVVVGWAVVVGWTLVVVGWATWVEVGCGVAVVLSTFCGGVMELELALDVTRAADEECVVLGEWEDDTDVDVATTVVVRTRQRFVLARFLSIFRFSSESTAGSGMEGIAARRASAGTEGIAARRASSRWWTPRAMWGLAMAERATERTTMALEKYMVVTEEGAWIVERVGEGLDGPARAKEGESGLK